jgi:hypothetical protein
MSLTQPTLSAGDAHGRHDPPIATWCCVPVSSRTRCCGVGGESHVVDRDELGELNVPAQEDRAEGPVAKSQCEQRSSRRVKAL